MHLRRKSFDNFFFVVVDLILHFGRSFITYGFSVGFVIEHDAFVKREDYEYFKSVLF